MSKRKWWRGLLEAERKEFADKVGYEVSTLDNVFNDRQLGSKRMVAVLVDNTEYTKHDFRPDMYDEE